MENKTIEYQVLINIYHCLIKIHYFHFENVVHLLILSNNENFTLFDNFNIIIIRTHLFILLCFV